MNVLFFVVFSITLLSRVSGEDPVLLETCSLIGLQGQMVPIARHEPPFVPNPPLLQGICTQFHNYSCCNYEQTFFMNANFKLLTAVYSKCPACKFNLMNLFCQYTCSPNQGTFVHDTQVDNSTTHPFVRATDFAISNRVANGIYDSCKWIALNGGVLVKDLYKTWEDFFTYMGTHNPAQTINFTTVLPNPLDFEPIPCDQLCSCQNCQPACNQTEPHIDFGPTHQCTVDWAGRTWECLGLGLLMGYVGAAAIIIIVATSVFIYRCIKKSSEAAPQSSGRYTRMENANASDSDAEPSKENIIRRGFRWWGNIVSHHPVKIFITTIVVAALCGVGFIRLQIIQDPQQLWVPPSSRAAQDKAYFDSHFGAYFRIEQVELNYVNLGPAITLDLLNFAMDIQDSILAISVPNGKGQTTLNDLCYKPLPGKGCLLETTLEFWQSNRASLNSSDPLTHVLYCIDNPLDPTCMSSIGIPNDPNVLLGGFNLTEKNYGNATALWMTFLLVNKPETNDVAAAWELEFLKIVANYVKIGQGMGVHIAYDAQRSVQDELSRESATDISTVAISYAVMFVYVGLALGQWHKVKSFLALPVHTKFVLAFAGVLVVIMSVVTAGGLCSAAGLPASLIISEVIPFLVLAIGVDNIFILVNTYERIASDPKKRHSVADEQRLGEVLSLVGPSIMLASLSEALAFLLGVLTQMPAVVSFSIYAGVAIFCDFLFQITCFAAVLVLDYKRTSSRRMDCIPCVQCPVADGEAAPLLSVNDDSQEPSQGLLHYIFDRFYSKFILLPIVQVITIAVFLGLLLGGIFFAYKVELGLDQRVALPSDSYAIDYFNSMDQFLSVGPPFYLVVKGPYDFTNPDKQNAMCSDPGCDPTSIINYYDAAPYVAGATYSWLDDYLNFALNQESCCQQTQNGQPCPPNQITCINCFNLDPNHRPPPDEFTKFLPWFLNSSVTPLCPLTGQAYLSDVVRDSNGVITASRMRLSHSVLKTQDDYINALKVAYLLADQSGLPVFPYSVFYIFFEQYLYIQQVAMLDVLLSLAGVFLVTLILLRNPWLSILTVGTVGMIEVELIGIMGLWGINLNAVSVVNMVMAIGISVEFCVHIAYAFDQAEGTKSERARKAVVSMGSSVFSGITLTKFLGVSILAAAKSQIFQVYYFRMYMAIVVLGAIHGLWFLPVVLSLIGTEQGSYFPFKFKKKNTRY